jgi:hypothetical protein
MPILSDDEIFSKIEANEISAITLDTSVIEHFGFRFPSKPLASLRQFAGGPIALVFSEIIAQEVKKRLRNEFERLQTDVKSVIGQFSRKFEDQRQLIDALNSATSLMIEPGEYATNSWNGFLAETYAKTIGLGDADVFSEVVRRYFGALPPFDNGGKKKYEFPDALVLVSLQHWNLSSKGFLLAISKDGDWEKFGRESDNIIVVNDLNKCLDLFNRSSHVIAAALFDAINEGPESPVSPVYDMIYEAIERELETIPFSSEAYSDFSYEIESYSINLQKIRFRGKPYVIEASNEEITFASKVETTASIEGIFLFWTEDSIDHDIVNLGSCERMVTESLLLELVITVSRHNPLSIGLMKIDVRFKHTTIDFGSISPDWGE